jgi:hypothetical protein
MTSEWRPIETGPKDGTDVLLYAPDAKPSVRVGHYVVDGPTGSGHWFVYAAVLTCREMAPSHWMPLPEPPK